MSEKKQPDIRFQGFHSDWERKEFLNAFDPSILTNTLSRANLNYEQGEVKNIHYGDVLIKFGEITDVLKEEIPLVTDADITKYKNQFLENGDIIFADAAEDETVGKATEISGITDEKVVSGLHTIACRPIDSSSTGYWGYYLNSSAYHNQLLPLMQGIKVLSISKRSLATTFVNYPNEENEQVKIGEIFKELDNLIALNQSKHDKLVRLKRACLEKMFPKDGSATPEIRFKGFSGKWEEHKFSDDYKICAGFAFRYEDYTNTGIPLINGESIQHGKITRMKIKYLPITFHEEYSDYVLKENDIVVGLNRPVTEGNLKISKIPIDLGGSLLYQRAGKIKLLTNVDLDFTYVLLEKEILKHTLREAVGSDQPFISTQKLDKWKMLIPQSDDEKRKIGAVFQNIDKLIALRKIELDKLKNIKKALLEKMFI